MTYHREKTDSATEGLHDEILVVDKLNTVQNRLHCVGAFLITANRGEVTLDHGKNARALLQAAAGDKLLTEVVSIGVHHNFSKVASDVVKDELNEVGVCLVQLLLQETGPALCADQSGDMAGKHRHFCSLTCVTLRL